MTRTLDPCFCKTPTLQPKSRICRRCLGTIGRRVRSRQHFYQMLNLEAGLCRYGKTHSMVGSPYKGVCLECRRKQTLSRNPHGNPVGRPRKDRSA